MRLIQLNIITKYKNLKDFQLSFDRGSFIDVFVGKNGTGKSNFFEALMEILRHLYEFNNYTIGFDYLIEYEINNQKVKISWQNGKLSINGRKRSTLGKTPLPDNILIYYSGHNAIVTKLVEENEESFKKQIKGADISDTRKFIGIGREYKKLLLALILLQLDSNKAKQFICKKLGLKSIGEEIRINLKRPFYARTKGYDIDRLDPTTTFWRPKGITKDFLDILSSVKTSDAKDNVRDEGYIPRDDYSDKYFLYFDIIDFKKKFKDFSLQELFRQFDNLKTIEMLDDISIELKLEDNSSATTDFFSDGQFQTVYIYSIIELFKDRNCITLLDEPDSFLHPEWQFEFLQQVLEITEKASLNNHVLMSSHSASTISKIEDGHLTLFEFNGNTVSISKIPKSDIIKSLSAGLISFTETEAQLNISHFLNNTSGAVLFTEGITDEMILETAWNKLYPGQKTNFEIQNAYSCGFLRNTIKDETLYSRHPTKTFFALFDFDEAYNDWKQLGDDIATDPLRCLTKKLKSFKAYSMLLPVPNSAIKKQVLNAQTGRTYCNRSLLTIELLFYGVPSLDKYFVVDHERTDGFIKFISDGQKVKFAEEEVPKIDSKYFEAFRPIFEFVKSKC